MKRTTHIMLTAMVCCLVAFNVMAISIESLDKVSVMMPKSEVLNILGTPHEVSNLGFGLTADIYNLKDLYPMVGTGCIYDEKGMLAGQAFIFSGVIAKETAIQINKTGFAIIEEKGNSFRLAGKDDDTGRPLVTVVSESEGLTIVMTFEKAFYEKRIK